MTFRKYAPYIDHIIDSIKDIEESINGLNENDFKNKKDVKDSNIRRIEVIGEAVKNISNELKDKYPEIEWKKIAGTRDKLMHHYFGVDLNLLWKIIVEDIPILKDQIQKVKDDLERKEKKKGQLFFVRRQIFIWGFNSRNMGLPKVSIIILNWNGEDEGMTENY